MRILVFSDTHTLVEPCIRQIEAIKGVDMVIHAGDHMADALKIAAAFPDIPVKCVCGNCDPQTQPTELLVEAEGKKIFVTHGHKYAVKYESDYDTLYDRARWLGAEVAVFGHTHQSCEIKHGGIILLNPGSVRSGRSFAVIETENGKIGTAICSMAHFMGF